ncbi:MAG: hypothetical protein IIB83_08380 [Bacteroidetes bacterium]|nr:hypothetical protein [Bacteroidota bacterium]
MTCGIQKQIAKHCDEDETLCPECESWMEEKFLMGGIKWLQCVNPQCAHTIDLGE